MSKKFLIIGPACGVCAGLIHHYFDLGIVGFILAGIAAATVGGILALVWQ